jgi:hypothetical protein
MRINSNDELDPKVLAAMRTLYAAPDGDSYWGALEARIGARIRAVGSSTGREVPLWSVLAQWATPGLAAAALLLAMAGALWARLDQTELRTTYEGFTQPMIADAMPGAAQLLDVPRDGSSQREATLTYVLSH